MSNRIKLSTYEPKATDKVFIDTNVWLYLFCPIGSYKEKVVEQYNKVFYKILKSECQIYTSALIVSEFFNTYCRIDFQIRKKENPKQYKQYKNDFRNTEEFNELILDVCDIINNKILKHAKRLNDNFDKIDMSKILIADKNFDFNDKYFANICEKNNIKVITNDKDFLNLSNNVDIITS